MNYTAASAAAAADDNVFYDSGREGRKIAHYSTFRTYRFSYATFHDQSVGWQSVFLLSGLRSKTLQRVMRQLAREQELQLNNVLFILCQEHKLVFSCSSRAASHSLNHYRLM